MEGNKVSIVIPVHQAENYIETTLRSIRNQTYTDWELITVVDGCTDRSAEVIRQFAEENRLSDRIRVIVREEKQGAARARNTGVDQATGRFIAYLDADDLWMPDKLDKQVTFMKKEDAAFSFTGYEFGDEDAVGTGKVVRVPSTLTYRQALKNTTIFTSTVMMDTEKIPKEFLRMPEVKSEDTAMWWKILRQGYTAYGLPENLTIYRRPAKSLSSNKLEAIRRIWNLYRRVEGLSVPYSIYNFCFWAVRAVYRRV